MPRKQYREDLISAGKVADFGHITSVLPGEDDEIFTFIYHHPGTGKQSLISARIEPSEYPASHKYQLYASDDASESLASCLQDCRGISGKPIYQALPIISSLLVTHTATDGQQDPFTIGDGDSISDFDANDYEQDEYDEDGINEDWAMEDDDFTATAGTRPQARTNVTINDALDEKKTVKRARADLRAVKAAGFKVGVLGQLSASNAFYVSIALRIAKFRLPEEVEDAWNVDPDNYLILLIHFPCGYRSLSFVESTGNKSARERFHMRVGTSNHYKLRSLVEAHKIFASRLDDKKATTSEAPYAQDTPGFRDTFISRPLENLLNDRLPMLLKYRLGACSSWNGAQRFYNQNLGTVRDTRNAIDTNSEEADADNLAAAAMNLPAIVLQDHITDCKDRTQLSFPLIAAQVVARYFVRCTEFCLVCFSKLETEVQAIKPYVCSNPLCLYQYMSLGFGPSIEHEIVSQPYVTDLLISFCYAAAAAGGLHEYPEGLGLMVPRPRVLIQGERYTAAASHGNQLDINDSHQPDVPRTVHSSAEHQISAKFDISKLEIFFGGEITTCPFRNNQWLVLNPVTLTEQSWHCRVLETCMFPILRVSEPIIVDAFSGNDLRLPQKPKPPVSRPDGFMDVKMHAYNYSLNECDTQDMATAILLLLDLLPSVQEMRSHLLARTGTSLLDWTDRICPASFGILRWIIASNKSCIMQVDQLEGETSLRKRPEMRVPGFDGYMQFRFATGAPDKEQRFINSIKAETNSSEFPTIFSWHGSAISNWHSIIREGLHDKKVVNGRAFGNGVYHAKVFAVSKGYSALRTASSWPHSQIKLTSAVALSEIVNSPAKFTSHHPYYVVPHLDWIQTRYLFVSSSVFAAKNAAQQNLQTLTNEDFLPQDPAHTPTGVNGSILQLPLSAIPKSRQLQIVRADFREEPSSSVAVNSAKRPLTPTTPVNTPVVKKRYTMLNALNLKALGGSGFSKLVDCNDDAASIDTDIEDLNILFDPPEAEAGSEPFVTHHRSAPLQLAARVPTQSIVAFTPALLQNLPVTAQPSFSDVYPSTSNHIRKNYAYMMKVQESYLSRGDLAEHGWYINPMFMEEHGNIFQWIAELHSFPLSLPLGHDMQTQNIQSIVLELRFPASFPFSPPFVRVIRPRFLPFANGGGGHVTAGGSICTELLTNEGWTAACSIETILIQIRVGMMSLDPRPARIYSAIQGGRHGGNSDYGVHEAVDAFKRSAAVHGWKIASGVDETAGLNAKR